MKTIATPNKKRGAVLVITAFSIFVLMGLAGLAIDLSHAYVNKSRMQNLADALAMSAVITLNKKNDPANSVDEEAAKTYAETHTFTLFKNSLGNSEINTAIAASNLTFTFAKITDLKDLNDSAAGDWKAAGAINDANFARVEISPMGISTWFAAVLGINQLAVSTSAVAGTVDVVPCDVAPVMMCADVDSAGKVKDDKCDDNTKDKNILDANGVPVVNLDDDKDCYGYELNALYCLKQQEGTWSDTALCPQPPTGSFGAGNFGFLDYDPPGLNPSLKYCAAGNPSCSDAYCEAPTDPVTGFPRVASKTGQNFGQVADGFNTRFNLYGGGLSPYGNSPDSADYPPDTVIGPGGSGIVGRTNGDVTKVQRIGSETELTDIHTFYDTLATTDITTNLPGLKGRRILSIPFVDCRTDIDGKTDIKVLGFGCFMMAREYGNSTQPYVYNSIDPSKKFLYGVFVGNGVCHGAGNAVSGPDTGFKKVILYKEPYALTGLGGHS
jgi:Flp pilus assembly protein TadG